MLLVDDMNQFKHLREDHEIELDGVSGDSVKVDLTYEIIASSKTALQNILSRRASR